MEKTVNNCIIVVDDRQTLMSVRSTPESTSDLDLSDQSLEFISKDAFVNLDNVRTLDLSKNSIFSLPAFVFSSLKNLEHLRIAENQLRRMANAFAGLENLRTLDLKDNQLWHIEEGYFHGLSKSTEILLGGNDIDSISSLAFERRPDSNFQEPRKERRRSSIDEQDYYEEKAREARMYVEESEESERDETEASEEDSGEDEGIPQVKLLIVDGCLKIIEYLEKEEDLPEGYIKRDVYSHIMYPTLSFSHSGIRSFQKGWYRLQHDEKRHKPVTGLDLTSNEIEQLTSDLLDELPPHLTCLTLDGNKIKRLERGVFLGKQVKYLNLNKNQIEEIEEGALEGLPLVQLCLAENRLRDTRFVLNLPSSLEVLRLEDNEIVELTAGAFSRMNKIHTFRFQGNRIETLSSESLKGLTPMWELDLSNQRLKKIELGAFRDLDKLNNINLSRNQLESLDPGMFEGWPKSECLCLNLRSNKLRPKALPSLPKNVAFLDLSENGIGDLKAGDFADWTVHHLDLSRNGIKRIEPGSFDLPRLTELTMNGNAFENLDGDGFVGLPNLKQLCLYGCGFTTIRKGFMKNLGGLETLNLNGNRIERLENGALFGIRKSEETIVNLNFGYLQVMQGGVFDDV